MPADPVRAGAAFLDPLVPVLVEKRLRATLRGGRWPGWSLVPYEQREEVPG